MLYLVSLGLTPKDISIGAIDSLKKCDEIFFESYTSLFSEGGVRDIEKLVGKKFRVVGREFVEQHSEEIIKKAKSKNIAFACIGDIFSATTHIDLLNQAKDAGISVKTMHAVSVTSAIAETGLFAYKFGPSTSVPIPEKSYNPRSFCDVICRNLERGLHTLVFLDLKPNENRYMTPNKAVEIILKGSKGKAITGNTPCVVAARLGASDQRIHFGKLKQILDIDFGKPPYALIICGKLHFMEEKVLNHYLV